MTHNLVIIGSWGVQKVDLIVPTADILFLHLEKRFWSEVSVRSGSSAPMLLIKLDPLRTEIPCPWKTREDQSWLSKKHIRCISFLPFILMGQEVAFGGAAHLPNWLMGKHCLENLQNPISFFCVQGDICSCFEEIYSRLFMLWCSQ